MIRVDLITGFLGAGKTTFIQKYAAYLLRQGKKAGIVENDYGAVNVDTMLLQELERDGCIIESVAGACDADCHRRRFKTKLIALGMSGVDRVLIEPSGVFDADEFFDALYEPPLDRWYEIGSVIAIVDAQLEANLSDHSEYLLASQVANAGAVLLSRAADASEEDMIRTTDHLNRAMESVGCSRRFGSDVIACDWDDLTDADFARIMDSGYLPESYVKRHEALDGAFRSLYFLNRSLTAGEAKEKAQKLLNDPDCGNVFRVKGFVNDGGWMQLNATKKSLSLTPIAQGQEVIIVIGEELNEERIRDIVDNKKG
ncbi:MAG: GTPase (G3E family) [Ruminococcus sp.]|nr:GTPase (G3E family) [Ruminococcus sp.]